MSTEQPTDEAGGPDVSNETALKAAEFMLATRQREESRERTAKQLRDAHTAPDADDARDVLAEMIDLQQHADDPPA
ncbi:MAG: hypothetical protein M3042_10930 [Actinomycetota bacterium]|nr:hypothetical protein [Actinomycetota bacterium]